MRYIILILLLFTALLPASLHAQEAEKREDCTNCKTYLWQETLWCWGDNPEETKRRWEHLKLLLTMVQELQGYQTKLVVAIEQEIDWLSANCPCLHPQLYADALDFYTQLLPQTKKRKQVKEYQAKMHHLKKLQTLYFGHVKQ